MARWSRVRRLSVWAITIALFPSFAVAEFSTDTIQGIEGWCASGGLTTGDFSGDGKTDFACMTKTFASDRWEVRIDVAPALADGSGFEVPSEPWFLSFNTPPFAAFIWCIDSNEIRSADFNGDGLADLYCPHNPGAIALTPLLSRGSDFIDGGLAYHAACGAGFRRAADFTGDGRDEQYCIAGGGVSGGASLPPGWCSGAGKIGEGDFNGDGRMDLYCHEPGSVDSPLGRVLVALSEGVPSENSAVMVPDPSAWIDGFCAGVESDVGTGDFDGDGRADLYCVRKEGDGGTELALAEDGRFEPLSTGLPSPPVGNLIADPPMDTAFWDAGTFCDGHSWWYHGPDLTGDGGTPPADPVRGPVMGSGRSANVWGGWCYKANVFRGLPGRRTYRVRFDMSVKITVRPPGWGREGRFHIVSNDGSGIYAQTAWVGDSDWHPQTLIIPNVDLSQGAGVAISNSPSSNTETYTLVDNLFITQTDVPVVADFNGDGNDDLYYQQDSGSVLVSLAAEAGPSALETWATGFCPAGGWLAPGDFDGDGNDDLYCYHSTNDPVSITIARSAGDPSPPTVTVMATDQTATEPAFSAPTPTLASVAFTGAALDTGRFTITRSGNPSAPLTVFLTIAGSARRGSDYIALPTSVTLPAGEPSTTLEVIPQPDALRERGETVEITLSSHENYLLGEPGAASLLIQDPGGPQVYIEGFPDEGSYRKYLPRGNPRGNELLPNIDARLRFRIWWDDPSRPGDRRDLYIQLVNVSQLPGSSLNTGSREYPDFLLEAAQNPDFDVIAPDELPGGGLQALRAFANGMPRGRENARILTISPYDFGGNGVISVLDGASGAYAEKRFPRDDDADALPDAWEAGQKYFNGTELVHFDTGAARSPGSSTPAGATDASDDSDWDVNGSRPAERRQIEKGDGFSAFEEYRGLFVNARHHRFNELPNDGPGGRRGGTEWKDVFVLDEVQAQPTVRPDMRFLREAAVVWHRVMRSDWKGGPKLIDVEGGETRILPIASNGPAFGRQRGVWLKRGRVGGPSFGLTRSTIAGGLPAVIDVNGIRSQGFADEQEVIDAIVTHEILHLMTIGHPAARVLTFSTGSPGEPSEDHYFFLETGGAADASKVLYWAPFRNQDGLSLLLESPDPQSVSPLNQSIRQMHTLEVRGGAFTRHGRPHSGALLQLTLGQPLADTSAPLELYPHTGFLNEPLYSGHASRLSDEDRTKVAVKQ